MWKWHFFLLFAFGCSCKPLIFPALLFRKFSISSFDFQSQQLHSAVLQVLQPDLLCWFSYPARIVLQFSDSILLLNMLHDHNHCHCFCVGALGRKVFLPEILQKTYRRYKPWIKEVIRGSYTHVQIHTNTSLVFRDFTRLVHWCPYIRKYKPRIQRFTRLVKLCLGFCKYEPRIRVVYEPRTATSLVYKARSRTSLVS